MRHVVFLAALLLVIPSIAASDGLDKYCGPTSPPEVCIEYTDAALKEHIRWVDANAENHPIIDSCFTTKDPSGCIVSFRTNQPDAYALEIAHMEQQLAQEEARLKTLLQEQALFERRYQAQRQQERRETADRPVIPMPLTPIVQPSSPLNPVR